ncbi:MAG: AAA family ATPase [Nanoarchaeota archaeon]|nr:AAA family ATPase [Nanoarchaeota archaeon]
MITKVTITDKYNERKNFSHEAYGFPNMPEGLSFDLDSLIVLLIGDNASGKTTFLNRVRDSGSPLPGKISRVMCELDKESAPNGVRCYDFAWFNKQQPRPDPFSHEGKELALSKLSKGEYTLAMIDTFLNAYSQARSCVLLLDEPEQSLSIRNRTKLVHRLEDYTHKYHHQLFIATHAIEFLELPMTNVICFDDNPAKSYRREDFNLQSYIKG